MIRNLLATTAIATLVATSGAFAQATTTTEPMAQTEQAAPKVKHAEGYLASNLMGETVYNGTGDDAEKIGEVTDLVIKQDGQVEALVVGVGGFLGIGQKDVALEFAVAEWAERDGDEWLVIPTNKEALEALPDFDRSAFTPQDATAEVGNTTPATGQDIGVATNSSSGAAAPATDSTAAATAADGAAGSSDNMAAAPATGTDNAAGSSDTTAAAPMTDSDNATTGAANDTAATNLGTDSTETAAIDRSTLSDVDAGSLSADNIIGTTVYGQNDENVGEISDVVLSQDGKVEAVIVDVGGFLGVGEKSVAVSMDNLAFMADGDGNHYLYTSMTQEQLEAQPAYDEGTFAENRDDQLLVVPAQ